MNKYVGLIGILALAALVCGCMSLNFQTKVQGNGDISDMRVTLNMTSTVYSLIQSSVQKAGYSTVKDYVLADFTRELDCPPGTSFDYHEVRRGETVTIVILSHGSFKPGPNSPIKTYRDGKYMVFEYNASRATPTPTAETPMAEVLATPNPFLISSTNRYGDPYRSGVSEGTLYGIIVVVYLDMPGKIVESNADRVDGERAVWVQNGMLGEHARIYAKSEIPAGLPGFESVLAITGVLAAGWRMVGRKQR